MGVYADLVCSNCSEELSKQSCDDNNQSKTVGVEEALTEWSPEKICAVDMGTAMSRAVGDGRSKGWQSLPEYGCWQCVQKMFSIALSPGCLRPETAPSEIS